MGSDPRDGVDDICEFHPGVPVVSELTGKAPPPGSTALALAFTVEPKDRPGNREN